MEASMKTKDRIEWFLIIMAYAAIFVGVAMATSFRDACVVFAGPVLIMGFTITGLYYICDKSPPKPPPPLA